MTCKKLRFDVVTCYAPCPAIHKGRKPIEEKEQRKRSRAQASLTAATFKLTIKKSPRRTLYFHVDVHPVGRGQKYLERSNRFFFATALDFLSVVHSRYTTRMH